MPPGEDFVPCDAPAWPASMTRVLPLREWDYADVWAVLRGAGWDTCSLYADGYTSLGRREATQRNPHLRREDGSYAPAWELEDGAQERAGRIAHDKRKADSKNGSRRPEGAPEGTVEWFFSSS